MTQAQILAFIEATKVDAELQEHLRTAADLDAVLAIARKAGFNVSREEMLSYQGASAELSDEELVGVSGGLFSFIQKYNVISPDPLISGNDLGPDNTQKTADFRFSGTDLLTKPGTR